MREHGSGTREVIEAALAEQRLARRAVMSLGSTEAVKNAVLHGLGVAIVSRLTVEHELRSRPARRARRSRDLRIRRDLHLVTLQGQTHEPAAVAFLELCGSGSAALAALAARRRVRDLRLRMRMTDCHELECGRARQNVAARAQKHDNPRALRSWTECLHTVPGP